jgi:SAM-dependent methyltransferase
VTQQPPPTSRSEVGCECPADVDPRIARYFDQRNRRRREGLETYVTGNVTRRLLAALLPAGPEGRSVLEAGCGPGALMVALLEAGAASATGVDLSAEAIEFARERSAAAGFTERTQLTVGDAAAVPLDRHDWVVLDKVICCYADMDNLVANTIGAAGLLYGFAVPASYGWRGALARLVELVENVTNSLRGRPCPGYVHDVGELERRLGDAGFSSRSREAVGLWHIGVFERLPEASAAGSQ